MSIEDMIKAIWCCVAHRQFWKRANYWPHNGAAFECKRCGCEHPTNI